jgi:uncharacterized RDD family membrane protein YckC
MVFQDISSHVELNKIGQTKSTAQMVDRFFSFVLDYLIISPFVMFTLYSVFSNGFRFWKTNPLAAENELFIALLAVCFVVLFALVQTFFVSIWNATPGQYFLKIRFEYEDEGALKLLKIFIRQILFWMTFILLGIPFISVMTNSKRKTFYDQVANVTVVSRKLDNFVLGFESEFKYWRALMATMTLFVGFLATAFIMQNYNKIKNRTISFNEFKEKNFFCEDLKAVEQKERLPVAIALNLVNQLSDACLDREADFVFWRLKEADLSLAYFAKSLTVNNTEKERIYLAQACEGQTPIENTQVDFGCKVAWHFKEAKFEELYTQLQTGTLLADVLKYELGLILNKSSAKQSNFQALKTYGDLKLVKKYQLTEILEDLLSQPGLEIEKPVIVDNKIEETISQPSLTGTEALEQETIVSRDLKNNEIKFERAPSSTPEDKTINSNSTLNTDDVFNLVEGL